MTGPSTIRVLQSFPTPRRTTNPYLSALLESLPPDVHVSTFSWRAALTSRYDVLHLHWPETLLRASTRPRTATRQLRFAILLLRLKLGRTALVRTLHNPEPHEQASRVERTLLRWCERRTTLWIRLNPLTPVPTEAPVVTILLGHYRDWFAAYPHPAAVPGRILFFGLVRPYKGVEPLLAAFRALPGADLRLRIVGQATSVTLARSIVDATDADPRIDARLEYVGDDVLAHEIGCAQLVVLPYRELNNSGAALLALSLDRPVLLPAVPVVEQLALEVGPGWVTTFDGELGPDDLRAALLTARSGRSAHPDLDAREWPQAGASHAAAYRTALARTRRSAGTPRT